MTEVKKQKYIKIKSGYSWSKRCDQTQKDVNTIKIATF
jgi:hypothetical protein